MVFVGYKAKGENKRFLLVLGVPYISLGLASLMWLYQEGGLYFLLWLLFVVWGMDTGGYLVGSKLKGPKLMPKISPNKTWSGLIGGLLFSVLGGSLVIWYAGNFEEVYIIMAVWALIFGFISQVGDLVESAIKRNVGVKDSSALIPGHGGVFDRIDALIFVAPFAYLWLVW